MRARYAFLFPSFLLIAPLSAQTLIGQLDPGGLDTGDQFGASVSIDHPLVAVGVPGWEGGGLADAGAVELFAYDGDEYDSVAQLQGGFVTTGDRFGTAVAVSGDLVLVGAPFDDTVAFPLLLQDAGSAYVFEEQGSSWTELAFLKPGDTTSFDEFGAAVALQGGRAVIGAPNGPGLTANAGRAYVFQRSPLGGSIWNEIDVLTADNGDSGDEFGMCAAVDGNRILIGAPLADRVQFPIQLTNTGFVYVYELQGSSWVQTARIGASDFGSGDQFGTSVALKGDRAIIGAPGDDDAGQDAGAMYVFERQGASWVQVEKLTPPTPAGGDVFGTSVAFNGTVALAGAPGDDDFKHNAGAAYAFEPFGASWVQRCKMEPTSFMTATGDALGSSVALDAEIAVLGAPVADFNVGDVYVFDLDPVQRYGCFNPPSSLLELGGLPAEGSSMFLGVHNPLGTQPAGSTAILLVSFDPAAGFPCGPVIPGWGMAGAGAGGELLVDLGASFIAGFGPTFWDGVTPAAFLIPVPANQPYGGVTVYFQGVLLTPGGVVRIGLTNGLEVCLGELLP